MKSLFLFSILFLSCASGSSTDKEVYICVSENAKVYHFSKECNGLKKCIHEIKKVSLEDAKSTYKRRVCGLED